MPVSLRLGHVAFFGTGAYVAGLLAVHGWSEPISALVVAAFGAGAYRPGVGRDRSAHQGAAASHADAGDCADAAGSGQQGVAS